MSGSPSKLLLQALNGQVGDRPPFWFMRQAGRYLPEYMKVREQAGSFLNLCFNPDLATEVTLQPIRRFGMDGAIVFSDILVVPQALGQALKFEEGTGPILDAVRSPKDLKPLGLSGFHANLAPVYETVAKVKSELTRETALIGFAGAPWTVASYMIEGGTTRDFARVKSWALGHPGDFKELIDLLVEATGQYLLHQIEAGAEVLQIFDSWAGVLSHRAMLRWSVEPIRQIVDRVRMAHPDTPMIIFPRGVGAGYLDFARPAFAAGLGLDTTVPINWARCQLQGRPTLQGNLDPQLLVVGGEPMRESAAEIMRELAAGPFIFNLGHGIVPETPPEHVAELSNLIREWRPNQ